MSQRDISATIDDIYGFKLSAEQISKNNKIGRIGRLRHFIRSYSKRDYETKECAVYNILGLWIQESESKFERFCQVLEAVSSRLCN